MRTDEQKGPDQDVLYDQSTLDLVRQALVITLKIAGPILLVGLVIGLVISILQAVTQIQDQSLTFTPKIVAMLLVIILLLSWIAERLLQFTAEMLSLATVAMPGGAGGSTAFGALTAG